MQDFDYSTLPFNFQLFVIIHITFQVWFQNKRSKERRMKQMTNGMVTGRGFFPGKGGRRGFPMIGDEFAYFPHDKPFHDFGPYPNFPPPDAGFFPPGPMGFMGHPPGKIMFYF